MAVLLRKMRLRTATGSPLCSMRLRRANCTDKEGYWPLRPNAERQQQSVPPCYYPIKYICLFVFSNFLFDHTTLVFFQFPTLIKSTLQIQSYQHNNGGRIDLENNLLHHVFLVLYHDRHGHFCLGAFHPFQGFVEW